MKGILALKSQLARYMTVLFQDRGERHQVVSHSGVLDSETLRRDSMLVRIWHIVNGANCAPVFFIPKFSAASEIKTVMKTTSKLTRLL